MAITLEGKYRLDVLPDSEKVSVRPLTLYMKRPLDLENDQPISCEHMSECGAQITGIVVRLQALELGPF